MKRLRDLGPWASIVLFVVLIGGAAWLMWWQSNRLDAGAVATLVGALFGGAAVLLGNAINAFDDRAQRATQVETRRVALKSLIAAELVSIAVDLVSGKRLLDIAFATTNDRPASFGVGDDFPRQATLTMSLGAELLTLEQSELDALVTLQQNLAITRANLKERSGGIGLLQLGRLIEGLAFDMEILAQCFERIAPTRRLQFGAEGAELASLVLRNAAKNHRESGA
jgi:hypothetical protein